IAQKPAEPPKIKTPEPIKAVEPPKITTPEPIRAVTEKAAEPPRIQTPPTMPVVPIAERETKRERIQPSVHDEETRRIRRYEVLKPAEPPPDDVVDDMLAHATVGATAHEETPAPKPYEPVADRAIPLVAEKPPEPPHESAPRSLVELAKQSLASEDAAKES